MAWLYDNQTNLNLGKTHVTAALISRSNVLENIKQNHHKIHNISDEIQTRTIDLTVQVILVLCLKTYDFLNHTEYNLDIL